jgi:hypothetical protein
MWWVRGWFAGGGLLLAAAANGFPVTGELIGNVFVVADGQTQEETFAENQVLPFLASQRRHWVFLGAITGVEIDVEFDADPYLAFRIELTNLTSSLAPVSFLLDLGAVAFATPSQLTVALDTTLFDTNGDGEASWLQTGNTFGIIDSATGFAFLLPPMQHDLSEPETTSSTCCPFPGPPPLPGSTGWNTLEALGFGNLSAGDTVLIEGYFCVAPTGSSCPARPVLTPEPRLGALALLSLAGLAIFSRRPHPS